MNLPRLLASCLIAALVTGAFVAAPPALATNFEAEEFPATFVGETAEVAPTFVLEGTVACSKATFSGPATEPSATTTLIPAYSGCTVFGVATTINANGCGFLLHVGEQVGEKFKGTTDITCPEGKKIVITALAGNCEIQIGAQSGFTGVEYANDSEAELATFTVSKNLTGLSYTKTKDIGICPLSGTGVKTNGTYAGDALVRGLAEEEEEEIGVAVGQLAATRLCKVKAPCALVDAYDKGQEIEATAEGVSVQLVENPALVKQTVICGQSALTATTTDKAGAPLYLEKFSVTFAECELLGKGIGCNVQKVNAANKAKLRAVNPPGTGKITIPMTLSVSCVPEVNGCQYANSKFAMPFKGGEPATIEADTVPLKWQMAGAGCFDKAVWAATYEVVKPNPVWVGR